MSPVSVVETVDRDPIDALISHARTKRALVAIYAGLAAGFAAAAVRILATSRGVASSDFMVFATGWWLILHGRGHELYNANAQLEAQRVVMEGAQFDGGLLAFLNPPHAALAGLPFGWLVQQAGAHVAFVTWTVANVGLLLLFERWLRASVGASDASWRWAVTFALLAFYPVYEVIRLGQLSILLAVAVLGLYRAVDASRPVAGAAWLIVMSVKPQLMLPLVVFVAMRRCYRLLAYATAIGVVAALVTSIVLGPAIFVDYARQVGRLEQFFAIGTPEYMLNLRGALSRSVAFLQRHTIERIAFGTAIAATACLGLVLSSWRIDRREDVRMAYALAVATALLFSPHLFVQDTVIWAVPVAFAAQRALTIEPPQRSIAIFSFALPILFAAAHFIGSGRGTALRASFDVQFVLLVAAMVAVGRMAVPSGSRRVIAD